jgi:hypothetical protein
VYVKLVLPSNGPGICRNEGIKLEPVNVAHIKNTVRIEIKDAARLDRTALSSPKVTVFRDV